MGLVLESRIPENVVNQMEEALFNHWNLTDNSSLGRVSVKKEAGSQIIYLQSVKLLLTSRFWASSNASKLFSHVGWKKDKSKVFKMKGLISLSRTSKLKYLSPQRSTLYENKQCNCNNTYNVYNQHNSWNELPKQRRCLIDPEHLRLVLNTSTGRPYFSWGSGLPLTRRKWAIKSCSLPSYCTAKCNDLSSAALDPCRLSLVLTKLGT